MGDTGSEATAVMGLAVRRGASRPSTTTGSASTRDPDSAVMASRRLLWPAAFGPKEHREARDTTFTSTTDLKLPTVRFDSTAGHFAAVLRRVHRLRLASRRWCVAVRSW